MQLFAENSFHGGAWRCGWKFATVGIPSALHPLAAHMHRAGGRSQAHMCTEPAAGLAARTLRAGGPPRRVRIPSERLDTLGLAAWALCPTVPCERCVGFLDRSHRVEHTRISFEDAMEHRPRLVATSGPAGAGLR